jgi:hypothetical protein
VLGDDGTSHVVHDDGSESWYKIFPEGRKYHREDGPANTYADGTEEWLQRGELHRVGGPARVEPISGVEQWYLDGVLHRDDGPAHTSPGQVKELYLHGKTVRTMSRVEEWYRHGKAHRVGGPAVITFEGRREWWSDGKRHRLDGPAIEWPDWRREWWLDNKLVKEDAVKMAFAAERRRVQEDELVERLQEVDLATPERVAF